MDTDALQSTQSDMLVVQDDVPLDAEAERLRQAIVGYLLPEDVAHIDDAIRLARQARAESAGVTDERATGVLRRDFAYVLAVAQTLAEALHIDAITLAAVLLDQVVEARLIDLGAVRAQLGGVFGEQVAQTIASLERFDALQRPAVALRRSAQSSAEPDEGARDRRRGRERQRQQDADALRKMFVAMAEDPRVVVIKIADRLRLMREVRSAADLWRAHHGAEQPPHDGESSSDTSTETATAPA
ncbi:MAG TPA: HD domain-containing protein, partial [Ktedonobacterales bacterium]